MSHPNSFPLDVPDQRGVACMFRVLEIVVPKRHWRQGNAGFHQNVECHVGESPGQAPNVPARAVQHDSQVDIAVRPEVLARAGPIKAHLINRITRAERIQEQGNGPFHLRLLRDLCHGHGVLGLCGCAQG